MNRPRTLALIYVERYGLSAVFFYLALGHWDTLTTNTGNEHRLIEGFPLLEVFRQITWIELYVFTGFMLLIGRRVTVPPQGMKDILIPLISTFYYLIYEAASWLPDAFTRSLCAPAWQPACLTAGLALNLLGFCIAVWATQSLGRSFGVWVEVKTVVTRGAYRRMRHPIYFGYIFLLSGFAVGNFSIVFFILTPLHIALMFYRAWLEEKRLAASSMEYQAYQKRTGFIFPKIFASPETTRTSQFP